MTIIDKILLKTEWYNSYFRDCQKYWHGVPNHIIIANVGSNSGKYAFDYTITSKCCFNFAMGPQPFYMDTAIIKAYHDSFCDGAVLFIPICIFSSVVGREYNIDRFRYYSIIPFELIPGANAVQFIQSNDLRRHPSKHYSPKIAFQNILNVVKTEVKHFFKLDIVDFDKNALMWRNNWMKEFSIIDLEAPLSDSNNKQRKEAVELLIEIINVSKKYKITPILILPPIHQSLLNLFSSKARDTYVYSFIREIRNNVDVQFLDYCECDSISNNNKCFSNAYFLNNVGAKIFTKRVLTDLNLI